MGRKHPFRREGQPGAVIPLDVERSGSKRAAGLVLGCCEDRTLELPSVVRFLQPMLKTAFQGATNAMGMRLHRVG